MIDKYFLIMTLLTTGAAMLVIRLTEAIQPTSNYIVLIIVFMGWTCYTVGRRRGGSDMKQAIFKKLPEALANARRGNSTP